MSKPTIEPMLPSPFRVIDRVEETADTVTLRFEPEGGSNMEIAPGQFTMVYVFGVGEVPISIAGGFRSDEPLTHTVRAVGAVTNALCAMEMGDAVGIRGPYGVGWPIDAAAGHDLIVAAGGIGLAPLRPVVLAAIDERAAYGSVSVVYGARSPGDLLYTEELHEWRSRFDLEVEVTVDHAGPGWSGDVGLVTNMLARIGFDPDKTIAMACGPEIMMKVIARELGALGVSRQQIYVSLERNMKCAIGFCGHCQFGPDFVCRDGPVVPYSRVDQRMTVEQL